MREHFDTELALLQQQLHDLGKLVLTAIDRTLDCLARQDYDLAACVVNDDTLINAAQRQLEDRAVKLIALQQPVARDLRKIVVTIAAGSELERIGDYARGIARLILRPDAEASLTTSPDLLQLGQAAQGMFEHALAALVTADEAAARAIVTEEEQIDESYRQIRATLIAHLPGHPTPARHIDLLFIAHNFERIADRSTNLAERVIYGVSAASVDLNS